MESGARGDPGASSSIPPKRRSRVACISCHTRRVRCDTSNGTPCSNCAASGEACHLIVSKRGKYARIHTKGQPGEWSWSNSAATSSRPKGNSTAALGADINSHPLPAAESSINARDPDANADNAAWVDDVSQMTGLEESEELDRKHADGSEMLYARLTELNLPRSKSPSSKPKRTVYLSESFVLSYIVRHVGRPGSESTAKPAEKLQYSIPHTVDDKARNLGHDMGLEPEAIAFLRWQGALSTPEKSISDRLIRTYFDHVHPAFPVMDRSEFAALYEANKLPLLTLHAVYLLASTLCDETLIQEAGYADRNAARKAFYNRAKAIYNADYETDKIVIVTALFLISFCWEGSMDEKDMWHWLGAAIGLAQAQGMHRSTARSDLGIKDQRLWKKIWWSLYIRDRHCASALGRPLRIRDSDCDVEMLQESDLEETEFPDTAIYGTQTKTHILFAIHHAKLSVLFGEILLTRFALKKSNSVASDNAKLMAKLETWAQARPVDVLRQKLGDSDECAFYADTLEMLYNHHLIVLQRPQSATFLQGPTEKVLLGAAKAITRIVDDLLMNGTLRGAQLQLVPSVFAALTMHVIVIRGGGSIQRQVAESNAKLCMLALSEWAKTWPPCGWLLRLFESLLESNHVRGSNQSLRDEGSSWLHTSVPNEWPVTTPVARSMSQSQYPWLGKDNSSDPDYSNLDPSIYGLFQDVGPQLQMPVNNSSDEGETGDNSNLAPFYFNPPGYLHSSHTPGIYPSANFNNSAFLNYLRAQMPEP